MIGGGSRSDSWCQIVCDIFGKKVLKPLVSDASYGAALLAGVGIGIFPDVREAVIKCSKIEKEFEPDNENNKKYIELFNLYLEVHDKLKDTYKNLYKLKS